jgi:hypothetical protein
MLPVLLFVLVAQASGQPTAVADIAQLKIGPPKAFAEIDTGKLKGDPVRLAFSADGSFYLRVAETDRWGNERPRHYVIASSGAAPTATDGEPPWANAYWLWKSVSIAPGVPDLRFEFETREQMKTAVGSVRDAGASQSRADPSQPQVATDAAQVQKVKTVTVRLKREIIAEGVNAAVVPGRTFGWAPAPMGVLAYVSGKKRLTLIDREGRKHEIEGAANVLLPAWSPDGTQIAYLQKKDRKKYTLMVVDVVVGR